MREVLVVVVRQEVDRARQQDQVAERKAGETKRGRNGHEPERLAFKRRMNRRREEPPELPQGDRQREEEPRPQAHRQRNGEGLGDAECDRLALADRKRLVQPMENLTVERERERARERARDQYDE